MCLWPVEAVKLGGVVTQSREGGGEQEEDGEDGERGEWVRVIHIIVS